MKKNTNTAAALATVSNTQVNIGTREIVAVAVARVETSLKAQGKDIKKQIEDLLEVAKGQEKVVSKATVAQGKQIAAGALMHVNALMAMAPDKFTVQENYTLTHRNEGGDEDEGTSTIKLLSVAITLVAQERSYRNDCVSVYSCEANISSDIADGLKAFEETQEKVSSLREALQQINKKLAEIPYAERQFTARMAEKVLAGTDGGKAMLAQVDEAIVAMGFGSLPRLTSAE
jgi:hypothetical protein